MRKWVILGLMGIIVIVVVVLLPARSKQVKIGLIPLVSANLEMVEGFKAALAERGYVDGVGVKYYILADDDVSLLDSRVKAFLALKPDLLLAMSTPSSQAAVRVAQGTGVPVIFTLVQAAADIQLVSSLSKPSGNVTGVHLSPSDGVRLQWLHRLAPKARHYYVPYANDDKGVLAALRQLKISAQQLGVQLLLRPVSNDQEIELAAKDIPADADAVFLLHDSNIESNIVLFAAAAKARGLPLSVASASQVEKGALMSFGFDQASIGRQAGRLAVEILHGTPAGNLPVETAESELYFNLKTAQYIGLKIDDAVLYLARRVVRLED